MPPKQCPECGRFLASGFVDGLATRGSSPCPGCGHQLSAAELAAQADDPTPSAGPPASAEPEAVEPEPASADPRPAAPGPGADAPRGPLTATASDGAPADGPDWTADDTGFDPRELDARDLGEHGDDDADRSEQRDASDAGRTAPERDPLAGWDPPGSPEPAALPDGGLDVPVAVGSTVAGVVLGALVAGRGRRVAGGALGALLGLLVALLRND